MTASNAEPGLVHLVHELCAAADAGDGAAFGAHFAEDAVFRFANNEPIVGREAVARSTTGTAGALPWVRHEVDQVAQVGDQLFCRFTIHTEAPGGEVLALPCVTVVRVADGLVVDYRVHMDLGPALAS